MSHKYLTTIFAMLAAICIAGPWFVIRYLRYEVIEGQATFIHFYDLGEWSEVSEVEYDFDGQHHLVRPELSSSARDAAAVGGSFTPQAMPQTISVYVRRLNPSAILTRHPQQWYLDNIKAVWGLAALFGWLALSSWRMGRMSNRPHQASSTST